MTAPIAAIILLKEEELLELFRTHGARSSETAMTPSALSISEDTTFRRLRDRAVIREGAPGRFYVDEETVVARRRTRRRLLTVLLITAAIVAIALLALTSRGAQT
jgi:hypothetical protein